jgi:hypothetical protein
VFVGALLYQIKLNTMKRILTTSTALFALLLLNCAAHATIYVVNNSNANPGQFYYLQAAIDSADAGDTLMLQPSTNSYGNVVLTKALNLIGIGHNPNKDLPLKAIIGEIRLAETMGIGSTFIGLWVNSFNTTNPPNGITYYSNGVTVRNCYVGFYGTDYGSNPSYGENYCADVVIEECHIKRISFDTYGNNILLQNSIIESDDAVSFGSSMTNVVVKNNLFIRGSVGASQLYATGAVFENNIFFRFSPASQYGTLNNCVFNNNLTYQTNNDAIIGGTNTGSNNIISQDPLFVNLNYSASPIYLPALYNYRIQATSPGHNAGTDGQDIGPYGNSMTFSETGESDEQPVIRVMNILNSTVPTNGTMNVHVKVTGSKND